MSTLSLWIVASIFSYALLTQFYSTIPAFAQETNASMISNNNTVVSNATVNSSSNSMSPWGDSDQALENQTVNYYGNASGYLVYPTTSNTSNTNQSSTPSSSISSALQPNTTKLPAVVMIHENRGLNEHIKLMADTLAKEGYVVLAVDLFNGQVASNQEEAGPLSGAVRDNPAEAIANLRAAVRYLASLKNVNASMISSLGWCFGGQQSLQLALNTEPNYPLASTVIYYGRLVTDPQELSKIKWPVLGIFGDQDDSIPVENVTSFKAALDSIGIPNEIYIYEGVGHAFANPSGDNYAPEQTADAWQKTLAFLKNSTGASSSSPSLP
ncbi:MAG: dienelactone hydrolase family protein [Nitrososphaeraceae archaeon]|nr:dienelactone hydrolase family protein [Nitrososphaeraceae archaeon]